VSWIALAATVAARVPRDAGRDGQPRQEACFDGVGIQGFEQAQVLGENLQNEICIQGIALGAAGFEGLAELGHRRRVDGINDQKVILQEGMNQGSTGLLDSHRQALAREALLELGRPGADDFGLLGQSAIFLFGLVGLLQAKDVF